MHTLDTPRPKPVFFALRGGGEARSSSCCSVSPDKDLATLHSTEQSESGYRRGFPLSAPSFTKVEGTLTLRRNEVKMAVSTSPVQKSAAHNRD